LFSSGKKNSRFLYIFRTCAIRYNQTFQKTIMQILGKLLLSIVVVCYISTAYGKHKTVKDNVVEGATHLKDNVVEGATHLKDNVVDGAKVAADAASSAATGAAKATKEYAAAGAHKTQEAFNEYVRYRKLCL
jgi:predicted phage-related endonuclease